MKLPPFLVTLLSVLATWFTAAFLMKRFGAGGLYLIPVGLILALLALNRATAISLISILQIARMRIPGLPFAADSLLMLFMGGVNILRTALAPRPRGSGLASERWLGAFILIVFVTIISRGFGFAMGGGFEYGGTYYINLLGVLLFGLSVREERLETKHIKWIVIGGALFGALPFVVELVYVHAGFAIPGLSKLVQVELRKDLTAVAMGVEDAIARYRGGRSFALALLALALVFPLGKRSSRLVRIALFAGCLLAMMASGFRLDTIMLLAVIFVFYWVRSSNRRLLIVRIAVLGLVGYVVLAIAVRFMPANMQRAVAFIPFLPVEELARDNADSSTEYRKEVWKIAIQHWKEYAIVGRGLTINVKDVAWLQQSYYGTAEFFYLCHNYHNGVLSLLLDFGVPGLIVMFMYLVCVCRETWRYRPLVMARYGASSWVGRFYDAQLGLIFTRAVTYFLFFGDIRGSIPWMIIPAAFIKIIHLQAQFSGAAETGRPLDRGLAVAHESTRRISAQI